MKKTMFALFLLCACAGYQSPDRATWGTYLHGASFTDMSDPARVAKKPIFLGDGGRVVSDAVQKKAVAEYGDKNQNESAMCTGYMATLENELYDALRRPGVSVQRAGTDVVIILVRDAIMEIDVADISRDGADTLKTISNILNKYDFLRRW